MKLRISQWLGCCLAVLTLLGIVVPASQASARRIRRRPVYRVVPDRYRSSVRTGTSIQQITSIPGQGYTNYVTGNHALYTLPGTVSGTRRLLTKHGVRQLANRQIRFMAYRKAITNRGSLYYKIVSQHHSIRGWIYQTDLRSVLDRKQQAASLLFGHQIINAEMKADESKHRSIVNNSGINLNSARRSLHQATASVKVLKGTPDYANAKQNLRQAYRYLQQVRAIKPSSQTLAGLTTIRSEYQRTAKSVLAAQSASRDHQYATARRDVKFANRSLRHVSLILSQIHNRKDRKAAMALFNQALSYVNASDGFAPTTNLSRRNVNASRLSNHKIIMIIKNDEKAAQDLIMNLYPHLDNFDAALMNAYQAQNDLNQAQYLVSGLKGADVQKTELNYIQANQHNINALWNV